MKNKFIQVDEPLLVDRTVSAGENLLAGRSERISKAYNPPRGDIIADK